MQTETHTSPGPYPDEHSRTGGDDGALREVGGLVPHAEFEPKSRVDDLVRRRVEAADVLAETLLTLWSLARLRHPPEQAPQPG